ncbi:MAG: respiratory nitrate reductase subunit gamma [Acidithiobacillus sp.]
MNLNLLLFGVYPYIAGTIFLVGSIIRYDREQYGWTSYSSQLLASRRYMLWASNLWHVGILMLFAGHFVGLLTPVFEWLGFSPIQHQWVASSAGITFGTLAMIGGLMLLLRRMLNSQVRAAGRKSDLFILLWLIVTLLLGLVTQATTVPDLIAGNVANMEVLGGYLKGIATFQPHPAMLVGIPLIYKIHMFFGMTMFLLFPFTRLVHIWTVPFNYLVRPYELVRAKQRSI